MADKRDDITQVNEDANKQFDGGKDRPKGRPENAETVQDVNEAADAEFNADGEDSVLGNQVGGLRGSSD